MKNIPGGESSMRNLEIPSEKENFYVIALRSAINNDAMSLEEAVNEFKKEVGSTGPEHLPEIEKAYEYLKAKQNKT